MAVMIEFEEAFNSISFDFIGQILNIFGFGFTFKNWVNILLGNTSKGSFKGVSIVNDHPTAQFNIY